jgi:phage gp29-like protein
MDNAKTQDDSEKPVLNEIATVQRDPLCMDYIGRTLLNPDKVLKSESGGKGIELYEDLLRDDKVGSTLQTRKLAVVGREWEIIPASDRRQDQKVADFVKDILLSFNYDAARRALLSGVVLGYKPAEIMWDYSEGSIWIKNIIGKSSRRFVFDLESRMRMLTTSNMIEGEELPERKFVIFRNISDNGSPYGDGLGRMLYWPVWFKKNAIKFWMIFADKFGSPTIIGKYPQGTQKVEQDNLLSALEAIQQESAIKIPDTMVIELLEAARAGTVDTYERLCNFMNSAIAQVLLGQTLTSEIGSKGSYAASQTHNDVRAEYVKADADAICECQNNSLIRWIVDYNFPEVGRRGYPRVWIRTEDEEDLKPLAERDQILVQNIGLPVAKKYFYDTYGIPEPGDGEELVNAPQPPLNLRGGVEQGQPAPGEFSEASTIPALIDAQKNIDSLVDNSLAESGLDLSQLYRIVDEADSYEELQQRIAELYQGMDMTKMNEVLAQAVFIADLKGRALSQ